MFSKYKESPKNQENDRLPCPIIFQGQTVSFRGSRWHFFGASPTPAVFSHLKRPPGKKIPKKQPFPMDTTFELYPLFGIYWVESPILLIFKMKTSNVDNPMYNFPMMISTNKKNSYRKLIREWSQGVSPKKKTTSPFKNSTKRSQPTNQAEIHKKSSC